MILILSDRKTEAAVILNGISREEFLRVMASYCLSCSCAGEHASILGLHEYCSPKLETSNQRELTFVFGNLTEALKQELSEQQKDEN